VVHCDAFARVVMLEIVHSITLPMHTNATYPRKIINTLEIWILLYILNAV
jgi:hypothetical protein